MAAVPFVSKKAVACLVVSLAFLINWVVIAPAVGEITDLKLACYLGVVSGSIGFVRGAFVRQKYEDLWKEALITLPIALVMFSLKWEGGSVAFRLMAGVITGTAYFVSGVVGFFAGHLFRFAFKKLEERSRRCI